MERFISTRMFHVFPTTAWISQNACSTRRALPQRPVSTLIRRTESISCASATRDLPTRCTRPSSVSATGYDARCELPRLRSRLFLECTENGADPLAVDIFRRRGVALRLKPRIAVHVVGGNHFSGTVVE